MLLNIPPNDIQMNKTPTISVIVPIYKAEVYLQECIDSILTQTYTNFELILVNDGSPDSCGNICNETARLDSRVRVIHQSNQGVTRARANGVTESRGNFICFVDSDDTIPQHALATLIAPIDTNTDIVLGKVPTYPCPPHGEVPLADYRKMCVMMNGIHCAPFAKLFRRNLFNAEIFALPRDLKIGEDAIMNIRLAYRTEGKVFCTATEVYEYRNNENSAMHTYIPNPEMEMLWQTYLLKSIPDTDMPLYIKMGFYENLIFKWMSVTHRIKTIPKSAIPYQRFLIRIKKQTNLRLGIYASILLYCTSPLIRSVFIGSRNLIHKLWHCVRKVA